MLENSLDHFLIIKYFMYLFINIVIRYKYFINLNINN